jgi:UDP-N-acetylglucosamine kinase
VSDRQLHPADFPVSAAEQKDILADLIWDIDDEFHRSSRPRLVYVTGQPAAGKSRTVDYLSAQLDSPAVVLDSDDLRKNHPMMNEIMARDPQRMDVLSNGPVGFWMSELIAHTRNSRYNLIVENTLTNPRQVMETAKTFQAAGYAVGVTALAVPEDVSRLGIVTRYLAGVNSEDFPRWTTETSHSSAYSGMVSGLEQMTGGVDRIEVYDRNAGPLYEGTDGASAATILTAHRDKAMTQSQRDEWTDDYLGSVERLTQPGMVTPHTGTVLTKIVLAAERIVPAEQLPAAHYRLQELLTP